MRCGGEACFSVLAHLEYSELYVLVGLTLILAFKDHNLMVLRTNALFARYLQHKADQFIRVLHQMRRYFVTDDSAARINLTHGIRVDGAGEDDGVWSLTRQ